MSPPKSMSLSHKLFLPLLPFLFTTGARAFSAMPLKKIFCYGDSLTAGTTPGREPHLFPYAPMLETQLKQEHQNESFAVRWKGFPGWMAASMVENQLVDGVGLRALIQNKGIDLCVLLAGTNDLGMLLSTESDKNKAAEVIAQSIMSLHDIAHEEGVLTLAIGIPSSGYQAKVPDAKEIRIKANNILQNWCDEKEGQAFFVEFPFDWSPGDERWGADGLHFSELGYSEIAKCIAPKVYERTSNTLR